MDKTRVEDLTRKFLKIPLPRISVMGPKKKIPAILMPVLKGPLKFLMMTVLKALYNMYIAILQKQLVIPR
jgi:hypothetical protein